MATRRYEHLLFSELDAIQRDPMRPGDDRLDAAEELRRRETDRAADPHGFDLPDAPTTREQSAASRPVQVGQRYIGWGKTWEVTKVWEREGVVDAVRVDGVGSIRWPMSKFRTMDEVVDADE